MLTPWKKIMTNLDSIFKSRDITLLTKVCLVKAMVFPVVIDAFTLWCWNTGVDCHFRLQGIFPTQGSNPGLPYWTQML